MRLTGRAFSRSSSRGFELVCATRALTVALALLSSSGVHACEYLFTHQEVSRNLNVRVVDRDGKRLPNVGVVVYAGERPNEGRSAPVYEGPTDADGEYRLVNLRPGYYEIATREGGWSVLFVRVTETSGPTATKLELVDLERPTKRDWKLRIRTKSIRGLVVDAEDARVKSAKVELASWNGHRRVHTATQTDYIGRFELSATPGRYLLVMTAAGFKETVFPIELVDRSSKGWLGLKVELKLGACGPGTAMWAGKITEAATD